MVQISWCGAGKRGDDYEWASVLPVGGVARQQLQLLASARKGLSDIGSF